MIAFIRRHVPARIGIPALLIVGALIVWWWVR